MSELQEGCNLYAFVLESLPGFRELAIELYDEVAVDLFRMELLNEFACCFHGAACGEEVVMKKDNVLVVDGVGMYLYRVHAVFLGVALLNGSAGELARFAAQHHLAPNLMATADDITKPRLSMPTIFVIPLSLYMSTIVSAISLRHSAFLNRVVMSLKFTPLIGQSGMQRRLSKSNCLFIVLSFYVIEVLL